MKTPSNQSHALRGEQLIALSRSGQNRQFWELPKVEFVFCLCDDAQSNALLQVYLTA